MTRIPPARGLVCAIVSSIMILGACGNEQPDGEDAAERVEGGDLTIAMSSNPGSLDPFFTVVSTAHQINRFSYESLVLQDRKGEVVPGLATSWDVADSSVTFHLNPDVTCPDGAPLTAEQVAANFEYLKDPDSESPWYDVLLSSAPFTVSSDDAAGTVTIETEEPNGFLLLGAGSLPIVCAAGMADRSILEHGSDGTGPYEITDATPGSEYVLTAREDYTWGPNGATATAAGMPETITFTLVENEATLANLLLAGDVGIGFVSGPDRQRLEEEGLHSRITEQASGQLFFNQRDGHPTASESLRRALVTALDLDELARVATGGTGSRATNLIPGGPCPADTVSANLPEHDLEEAQRQLGASAGSGDLSLLFAYQASSSGDPAAAVEFVSEAWSGLGVDVTIEAQTDQQLNETFFETGNWDVYWTAVNVPLPTQLVGLYSGPTPPDGLNFAGIANDRYAELAAQATTLPPDEACPLWNQAEEALVENLDLLPVANTETVIFGSDVEFDTDLGNLYYGNGYYAVPTSIRMME